VFNCVSYVCVVLYLIVLFYVLFVLIVLFYVLFVSIVLFYVLFVCKCVLYYYHRVSTQLQLTNISYQNKETPDFTFQNFGFSRILTTF